GWPRHWTEPALPSEPCRHPRGRRWSPSAVPYRSGPALPDAGRRGPARKAAGLARAARILRQQEREPAPGWAAPLRLQGGLPAGMVPGRSANRVSALGGRHSSDSGGSLWSYGCASWRSRKRHSATAAGAKRRWGAALPEDGAWTAAASAPAAR